MGLSAVGADEVASGVTSPAGAAAGAVTVVVAVETGPESPAHPVENPSRVRATTIGRVRRIGGRCPL
ncbi:hypothetical protein C8054_09255 [Micromonospora sp. RP3T]|nr:hypothetical protein C8054_09255 [Micromonospora sp. RP3T]